SSLHKSLVPQTDGNGVVGAVQASRGAGAWVSFARDGSGNYVTDADVTDRLVAIAGGWRYTEGTTGSEESYNSQGMLTSASYSDGTSLTYTYSDSNTPAAAAPSAGLILKVQDQSGRSVQFQYEQPSGVSVPRIK